MLIHQAALALPTRGQGLSLITDAVVEVVRASGVQTGLCSVFVQHTSCSLLIQENADPTARHDLERWFSRLAPENDPRYTHTLEGPDDMPAHLRAAVTSTSEQIPVTGGRLALGMWQGLYLFEHRDRPQTRRLVVTVLGE